MEKGETSLETLTLPVDVIQHIQSLIIGKEAARSSVLSKLWHSAWLTHPTVVLNDDDFNTRREFEEFSMKTMLRYLVLNHKVQSFMLHVTSRGFVTRATSHILIVSAMEAGATDLNLDLRGLLPGPFTLPREVLRSKTLLRLAASRCDIDGEDVSCSSLKTLILENFGLRSSDDFKNIMISCCDSLEELSLSKCIGSTVPSACWPYSYTFRKLRRLCLDSVSIDTLFFTDFASRFPCLKDLSILNCHGSNTMHIASDSLQTICLRTPRYRELIRAKFDVPNIQKFAYSGIGLSSHLHVNGAPKECELDLSMTCSCLYDACWFLNLKRFLTKFRLSSISLYIDILEFTRCLSSEHEIGTGEVEEERIAVENLEIVAHSSLCRALLLCLLGICRPRFITHYWLEGAICDRNESLSILCKGLMQKRITPHCGIPNQVRFGKFGLKKVNMEVYEKSGTEWRLLVLEKPQNVTKVLKNRRKIRFELIWD